jgi:hypothetical protein
MYDLGRNKEDYFRKAHELISSEGITDKQAFVRLVSGFGTDIGAQSFIQREQSLIEGNKIAPPAALGPTDPMDPLAHATRNLPRSRAADDIVALMNLDSKGEMPPMPSSGTSGLIPTANGLAWAEATP